MILMIMIITMMKVTMEIINKKDDDHLGSKSLHVQLRDKHVVLLILNLVNIASYLYGHPDILGQFWWLYLNHQELVTVGEFCGDIEWNGCSLLS